MKKQPHNVLLEFVCMLKHACITLYSSQSVTVFVCVIEWCSYSCATVYLQMYQFGIFPLCLMFTVVLVFWCFLTSLLFLLVTAPVRRKGSGKFDSSMSHNDKN